MTTFRKVEPLELENRRTVSIEELEDGTQYVDFSNETEKQYWYLMRDEAGSLSHWLRIAIGFNPATEATPFAKFSKDRKKIITTGHVWDAYEARALRDWLNYALGDGPLPAATGHYPKEPKP